MIDLTPLDVRKKRGDFRHKLKGYDPEEVDSFLELVAERMEELVRENFSFSESNQRLEAQLKALEEREKAVQDALVTAQQLRDDVQNQSHREAEGLKDRALKETELLRAQAEAEIERRLGDAEGLIRERQRALEELERNRQKFLKGFRSLLERELDSVEVEEARKPLEDATLDLDLRGWSPAPVPKEEGRGEPDDGSAASPEGGQEGAEAAELPREADPEDLAEEEQHQEEDHQGEGGEGGEGALEDGDGSLPIGQEPLWLSSLLKQDDEETEDEDD